MKYTSNIYEIYFKYVDKWRKVLYVSYKSSYTSILEIENFDIDYLVLKAYINDSLPEIKHLNVVFKVLWITVWEPLIKEIRRLIFGITPTYIGYDFTFDNGQNVYDIVAYNENDDELKMNDNDDDYVEFVDNNLNDSSDEGIDNLSDISYSPQLPSKHAPNPIKQRKSRCKIEMQYLLICHNLEFVIWIFPWPGI